jgi:hypothetical protein
VGVSWGLEVRGERKAQVKYTLPFVQVEMGWSKMMIAILSMGNGQAHASMIQSRMDLMLPMSAAWLQLADELMANLVATNRQGICWWVQMQPSDNQRVWLCSSAVLFLLMSVNAVVFIDGECRPEEVGSVGGR